MIFWYYKNLLKGGHECDQKFINESSLKKVICCFRQFYKELANSKQLRYNIFSAGISSLYY